MPRLIDAELLRDNLFVNVEHDKTVDDGIIKSDKEVFAFKCGWNDALKSVMENAPTIDAVELVRCKDCKHYRHDDVFHRWYCSIGMTKRATSKDDYCSWGERREDA